MPRNLIEELQGFLDDDNNDRSVLFEEQKSVRFSDISKTAKRLVNTSKWDREMKKLGVDTEKYDTGLMDSFIFPVVVAIVKGQKPVDNKAVLQARSMLKSIIKSLQSKEASGEEADESFDEDLFSALDKMLDVLNEQEDDDEDDGDPDVEETIAALRDTDYFDQESFFKMVQLLKGIAVASKEDETAEKFMKSVSDAMTIAAKKTLGEDVIGEMKMYEIPRRKGDLDAKTPANLKKHMRRK